MAVTRRQVLGDVVTAYEVSPEDTGASNGDRGLAQIDQETANGLFERLMRESKKLAEQIKPEVRSENTNSG